jgi:hypothetical protein
LKIDPGLAVACASLEKLALALSIYTILITALNYFFLGTYYALTNFLLSATFLVIFTTVLGLLGWKS